MTQKNIDENSYLLSRLVDKSISQTILLKCGSYSTLKLLVYELILLLFEQKEDRKGNKDKQDSSNINVYHSLSSYIEHIQIRLKHFEQKTLRFSLTKV